MRCAILAVALLVPPAQPGIAEPSYVPQRVFDTRVKGFSDFESMIADLARADTVFVGEQHDDRNTHRLELAIVEGLTRRGVPVVIALEMFERDVQPDVERYTGGTATEAQFLAASRPWPRYAADYRPLVEFARAHDLPIVASNVPRRIAAQVSQTGMTVLDHLGNDRRLAALEPQCPTSGPYYDRFGEMMQDHPAAGAAAPAETAAAPAETAAAPAQTAGRNDRFYFAQCLKDETMGESVADAFHRSTGRVTIVHLNGAFHSDFGDGAAASARRRLPGRRIAVVSVLPVADLDSLKPGDDDLKRADYLLFTVGGKQ